MSNSVKVFLSAVLLLAMVYPVFAQEVSSEAIEAVELDEDVQPEDLEVGRPRILPGHFLYGFKDGWRRVQEFFTFNSVAKLRLEQKFASERIIELKELVKRGAKPEIIKTATEKYDQESEEIKARVMALKEKASENPELNTFLDKFLHQQTLHHRILQRLEEQVPAEALEKIKEQREKHLERFKDVMLKLEDVEKIPERLEQVMEKIKGSEFKGIKDLEMLNELREKMPEEVKERIQEVEGRVLQKFQEKLEQMPAEKQEKLKDYMEKISGAKETQLEILENLKSKLEDKPEIQEGLEKIKERVLEKEIRVKPECQALWWFDDTHRYCQQGEFCGMYMYLGLRTFKTKAGCEGALQESLQE